MQSGMNIIMVLFVAGLAAPVSAVAALQVQSDQVVIDGGDRQVTIGSGGQDREEVVADTRTDTAAEEDEATAADDVVIIVPIPEDEPGRNDEEVGPEKPEEEPPAEEEPEWVFIGDVSAGGTACPQGSLTRDPATNGRSIVLKTTGVDVYSTSDVRNSEIRKFCQMTINLEYPEGWTYALGRVNLRGTASIRSGSGTVLASAWFQGDEVGVEFGRTFAEGSVGDYHMVETLANEELIWAPCEKDRALNAKIEARVTPRAERYSFLTIQDRIRFRLRWQRCDR